MSKLRSGLANDRRRYGCYCAPTPPFQIGIVPGPGSIYAGSLVQVAIPGTLYDSGYHSIPNTLDDGDVPIPMGNMVFRVFGTDSANAMYWSSNNAILFGTPANPSLEVNIPRNLAPAILFGNYDRALKTFFYTNLVTAYCSITVLRVAFYDYYTDTASSPTYQYQIRLIRESAGAQRQFVEVYAISSPPSPGYSTANIMYPSGVNVNGYPVDSTGNTIDSTKLSPYNITDGTRFLNPCGTTYSNASPSANTSFVFSSDSAGSSWVFSDNSHVNV
jgi:hypothetical protein